MRVLRPIDPGAHTFWHEVPSALTTRLIADREPPLLLLIDEPSTGLRPVAACGSPTAGKSRSHDGLHRRKERGVSPGGGRLHNPCKGCDGEEAR